MIQADTHQLISRRHARSAQKLREGWGVEGCGGGGGVRGGDVCRVNNHSFQFFV